MLLVLKKKVGNATCAPGGGAVFLASHLELILACMDGLDACHLQKGNFFICFSQEKRQDSLSDVVLFFFPHIICNAVGPS